MKWQDYVVAACQVGFILALIPTLRGKDKPAASTSTVTSVLVLIIAFSLATLKLWLSFVLSTCLAMCWAAVALQKIYSSNQRS